MRQFALCVAFVAAMAPIGLSDPTPPRRAQAGRVASNASDNRPVVVADCRVRLIDEVTLAAERTGILDEVAEEGTLADAGSIVARMRDHLLRATLAIAEREAANEVEIRFARKASDLAQLKYLRGLDANKSVAGTVSELELRELRLNAEKALLQIEQAEHQLQVARLRRDEARELLGTCQIESPLQAVVVEVLKRPGEVVREGEPIVRLASSGRMRAEGYVSMAQAALLRRGLPVEVQAAGEGALPQQPVTGQLMLVDLKIEPVSGKVRVGAVLDNSRGLLRDGMLVNLIIRPRETELAGKR